MVCVKAIGYRNTNPSNPPADKEALVSLATKLPAGGGLASDCMVLLTEDKAFRASSRIEEIRIKERAIKQLRRKRMALLRKRMRARNKASSLGVFGKTFGGIMNAVASIVSVFCPPAGTLMKLGGALVSSQCKIAAASCSQIAERAVADAFVLDSRREIAEEGSAELVDSLRNAVEAETRMANRISALVESEQVNVILR